MIWTFRHDPDPEPRKTYEFDQKTPLSVPSTKIDSVSVLVYVSNYLPSNFLTGKNLHDKLTDLPNASLKHTLQGSSERLIYGK